MKKTRAAHAVPILCSLILYAANGSADPAEGSVAPANGTVMQVLERNRDAIMAMPHVVAVGIGQCDAEPCIKILVSECSDELKTELRNLLENHPYSIEQSKPLQTLPSAPEP